MQARGRSGWRLSFGVVIAASFGLVAVHLLAVASGSPVLLGL